MLLVAVGLLALDPEPMASDKPPPPDPKGVHWLDDPNQMRKVFESLSLPPPPVKTLVYRRKIKSLIDYLSLLHGDITRLREGSEAWNGVAEILDQIFERMAGGMPEPRARMSLLESIELAVTLANTNEEERETFRENCRSIDTMSLDERAAFVVNSGFAREYLFRVRPPWEAPVGLVHFDFHRRDGMYSDALGGAEAQAKLAEVMAVWNHRGAPKKGQATPDKWGKVQELMALIGLEGATPETIRAEWNAHRKKREFSPQKVIFKKRRP